MEKTVENILEVEHLNISFGIENVVLDSSFTLAPKQVLGIVGESGSGKSMTAFAITRLTSKACSIKGKIKLKAIDLLSLSEKELLKIRGQSISMVFQEPMSCLNPTMKIGKQIEEPLIIHTDYNKEKRKQMVIDMINKVKLKNPEDIYNMYPYQLSGGMRQRVMIAIAMILKPDILICDEPTTALDVKVQDEILKLIKTLDTSIIFISHDLRVIKKVADNIIVMKDGKILEQGNVEKIFNFPQNIYTKKLLEAALPNPKKTFLNNNKNVLEINSISLYYGSNTNRKNILTDFSMNIKEGEIVGLVGPSGCGKTTLSKAILGIHNKYEGEIKHFSENPQMIFQDSFTSLNPKKTIGWIIEEPLRLKKKYTKQERKDMVLEVLKDVGLSKEYYSRYPKNLSGGQRQRVSIAAAIVSGAKLIIADEPVSALDVTVGQRILDLILKLQKEKGLSMLFISHDPQVIKKVSDRVIKL